MPEMPLELLSPDRRELVESWGMNLSSVSYVHRPTTIAQIQAIFEQAAKTGTTIAPRGAGCSYGDASLNERNVVLDTSRMNRILAWDPQSGRIELEPGVTIRQLWQYVIEDGWWPPVVPGTMFVTIGGGAGMNFHGKNNFAVGPIGDHITEFDILLPTGEIKTCTLSSNTDLFYAAIGGFGQLGVFTRIVLQLKRVYSGCLKVNAFATKHFGDIIHQMEARKSSSDYMVGWIDCFAKGADIGRGVVHTAHYVQPGEDTNIAQTLRVKNQELPDTLFGVFPKSAMHNLLRPFNTNPGMQMVNFAKFIEGSTIGNGKTVLQPHAQFSFLLDYVPNWKHAYKPGSLIQFQSFVPKEYAETVFTQQLMFCQRQGIVPFLGVFKRHRPDNFLMTHAVDGFSFALDFPVTETNATGLKLVTDHLANLVVDHGGRFYFAKDSTLTAKLAHKFMGNDRLQKFAAIKAECDPNGILQTELSKRLFPELTRG